MSYIDHAKQEFRAAGWISENGEYDDDMQKLICKQILELLALFSEHGHSGSTAPYAIDVFKKLASFEPLVPLTGEDFEWNDTTCGSDVMWQNKRCSHVFKEANGQAYDSTGRIFREPNGRCYTGKGSRVNITFPYTPKREYVDVNENGEEI